jgi:hypothetical protein
MEIGRKYSKKPGSCLSKRLLYLRRYVFLTYYQLKALFNVKFQLFVTDKDPDPDPHWFGSLDPYPDPNPQ